MHYKLVFEQFVDCFKGLATSEIANPCYKFLGDVFVVAHTHLDSCQDPQFLLGHEIEVLSREMSTEGSSFMVVDYQYKYD